MGRNRRPSDIHELQHTGSGRIVFAGLDRSRIPIRRSHYPVSIRKRSSSRRRTMQVTAQGLDSTAPVPTDSMIEASTNNGIYPVMEESVVTGSRTFAATIDRATIPQQQRMFPVVTSKKPAIRWNWYDCPEQWTATLQLGGSFEKASPSFSK